MDELPYLDDAKVFSDMDWVFLRDCLGSRIPEDSFIVAQSDNGSSIWRGLSYDQLYVDEAAYILMRPDTYRTVIVAMNKRRRRRLRLARRHRQMPRGF